MAYNYYGSGDQASPEFISGMFGLGNTAVGGAFGLAQGYFNNQSQEE